MAPSPLELPPGCAFRERCPRAGDVCGTSPDMQPIADPARGQAVRCHHPLHWEAVA
jgi:peptide/nickel transport system ATP-binding protein